ncbi:MAG TPA: hypothetical protein VN611_06030, partial [Patescibacteria group bacterium]|nr:hypothetical protein [Patescibacteria group bacterium]
CFSLSRYGSEKSSYIPFRMFLLTTAHFKQITFDESALIMANHTLTISISLYFPQKCYYIYFQLKKITFAKKVFWVK